MITFLNWTVMISVFVCLTLMGAFAANFGNIFRDKKEDNLIFNAISWLPRQCLKKLKVSINYFSVALMSFLLSFLIISANIVLGFSFG